MLARYKKSFRKITHIGNDKIIATDALPVIDGIEILCPYCREEWEPSVYHPEICGHCGAERQNENQGLIFIDED